MTALLGDFIRSLHDYLYFIHNIPMLDILLHSSVIKKMPVWLVFIHQEVLLSVSNVAIMRETSYQIEITYQNVSLSAH
jgi:hypothetical protein